jgi:hypothetical protein
MTWLEMKNVEGEWPSAYHGVKNPNKKYKQYSNTIKSILSGLERDEKDLLRV